MFDGMSAIHNDQLSALDSCRATNPEFNLGQTIKNQIQINTCSGQAQNINSKDSISLLTERQFSELTSSSVEVIPENTDFDSTKCDHLEDGKKYKGLLRKGHENPKWQEWKQNIESEFKGNLETQEIDKIKMEEISLIHSHENKLVLNHKSMELLKTIVKPVATVAVTILGEKSPGKASLLEALGCRMSETKQHNNYDVTMLICNSAPLAVDVVFVELGSDVTKLQYKLIQSITKTFIVFTPWDEEHLKRLARFLEQNDEVDDHSDKKTYKLLKQPQITVILEDTSDDRYEVAQNPSEFLEKEMVKYDLAKAVCCKMRVYHFPTLLSNMTFQETHIEQSCNRIWRQILTLSEPFTVADFIINGMRFAQLISAYVDVLNNDNSAAVTEIIVLLRSSIQKNSKEMVELHKSRLLEELKSVMAMDNRTLEITHEAICTDVVNQFQTMSMISGVKLSDEVENLKSNLHKTFWHIKKENDSISREKCSLLLQHCFENVVSKSKAGYYNQNGSDKYKKDCDAAVEQYKRTEGKGPLSEEVLNEYLENMDKAEVACVRDNSPPYSMEENMLPHNHEDASILTQIQNVQDNISQHSDTEVLSLLKSARRIWETERNLQSKTIETKRLALENENLKKVSMEREAKISNLEKEISKLQDLLMNPNQSKEVTKGTDTSSNSSLSGQEKEWVRVVETTQNSATDETKYKCEETTEKEINLQKKLKKLRAQVSELSSANKDWEKYCQSQDEYHRKQIDALVQDLSDAKKQIKQLEIKDEEREYEIEKLDRVSEAKVKEAEEQKTKAINFATAQADKVDHLKKSLRKEQVKSQELSDKVTHLESVVTTQKEEIEEATKELSRLKESTPRSTSHQPPQIQKHSTENLIHLTTENQAPAAQPPSLRPDSHHQASPVLGSNYDRSMVLRESRTEVEVLKQQVTIYKEDFDKERRDRERAQSEIASIQNACHQLTDDVKLLQDELRKKNRETEALRAAREQDRYQHQKKQDEIQRLNDSLQTKVRENRELKTQIEVLRRQQYNRTINDEQPPPPYDPIQRPPYDHVPRPPYDHVPIPPYEVVPSYSSVQNQDNGFLPPEWRRQIQQNFGKFHTHLKPYYVIMELFTRNIISYRQKEEMDVMNTDYQKADYIINNIILRGTKETVAAFKEILLKTNQTELARLLPSDNAAPGRTWKCRRCTYENPGNLIRCEMCNSSASHVNQFIGRGIDQCDSGVEWVVPARQDECDLETDGDEEEKSKSCITTEND